MRRRRRLEALYVSLAQNLERHRSRFLRVRADPSLRVRDDGVALTAIETLNSWRNFVRAYYLSCCLEPRGSSGGRVSLGRPLLRSDPIGFAVTTFKPQASPSSLGTWSRRDEPAWHDPATLRRLAHEAHLSNAADVDAAFSPGMRVFTDLPVLRNYFAHRNQLSRRAALETAPLNSIPTPRRPSEILLGVSAGRPQSLMLDWFDDIRLVAEYLCD
jgi:hypothetical protein